MAFTGTGGGRFQIRRLTNGINALPTFARSGEWIDAADATPAANGQMYLIQGSVRAADNSAWVANSLRLAWTDNDAIDHREELELLADGRGLISFVEDVDNWATFCIKTFTTTQTNYLQVTLQLVQGVGVYNRGATYTVGWTAPEGPRGAAFIRIDRLTTDKPTDPIAASPTDAEVNQALAISTGPTQGDVAVINFQNGSCAFQFTGSGWVPAEAFIDGNLVVAGSIFTNIGIGAGIADPNVPLEWVDNDGNDSVDAIYPTIDPVSVFSGAYLGQVSNDTVNPSTMTLPANPHEQQILLVGNETEHLFWDGQSLSISGVRLEDPEIVFAPVVVPATIPTWDADTTYARNIIVIYLGNLYSSVVNGNIGNIPSTPDSAAWERLGSSAGETTIADYADGVAYAMDTVVSFGGQLYRAIQAVGTADPAPTPLQDNDYWEYLGMDTQTPAIAISATPPANPINGWLWYDTTIGRLFIYVAQAAAWAEANP